MTKDGSFSLVGKILEFRFTGWAIVATGWAIAHPVNMLAEALVAIPENLGTWVGGSRIR